METSAPRPERSHLSLSQTAVEGLGYRNIGVGKGGGLHRIIRVLSTAARSRKSNCGHHCGNPDVPRTHLFPPVALTRHCCRSSCLRIAVGSDLVILKTVNQRIAEELDVREGQVAAAVDLLDGGATVPFIARYRKEVTGTLDDAQLRLLDERLRYLRELDDRRDAVLTEIDSQGKLDDQLRGQIMLAETKARLEDIYLPLQAEAAHQGADRPRGPATSPSPMLSSEIPPPIPRSIRTSSSTVPGRSSSSASPRTPIWSVNCVS